MWWQAKPNSTTSQDPTPPSASPFFSSYFSSASSASPPSNSPPSSSSPSSSSSSLSKSPTTKLLNWKHYLSLDILLPTLILTSTILGSRHLYRVYLRRIPGAVSIEPAFWRRRSLLGQVTSVGDGDGFRLFHTPGGRLAGWGWMVGRRVPVKREELKGRTISIRLAGIDAPELSHFGHPAQPGGEEALRWLTDYILGRRVRAYIHRRDQYERAVATVYVWQGGWRRDIGLEMLNRGLATVYEAKTGSEWGGHEAKYRRAEARAQWWRRGVWKDGGETPRDFKTRMSMLDGAKGEGDAGKAGRKNT